LGFFTELSRRASVIDGEKRPDLERRIGVARELMASRDAVERFLQWTLPDEAGPDADGEEPDED
jgi:hypothetical protein